MDGPELSCSRNQRLHMKKCTQFWKIGDTHWHSFLAAYMAARFYARIQNRRWRVVIRDMHFVIEPK